MYLIFDTETTGLPKNYKAPITDLDNWPRVVQLAWQVYDLSGKKIQEGNFIVRPEGFSIPFNSEKVHGISTQRAMEEGIPIVDVFTEFEKALAISRVLIGHNLEFDERVVGSEYVRLQKATPLERFLRVDTKETSTEFCAIPGGAGGGFKWPTLDELHRTLFEISFTGAHDALADVAATARCFLELLRREVIMLSLPEEGSESAGLPAPGLITDGISTGISHKKALYEYIRPEFYMAEIEQEKRRLSEQEALKQEEARLREHEAIPQSPKPAGQYKSQSTGTASIPLTVSGFTHLHCHSQYSVLRSPAQISDLIAKAKKDGAQALALTDLGNMFGAFSFAKEAHAAGIKPILGCECYVVEDRTKQKFTREHRDHRTLQPFLAKNELGYRNLSAMVSKGYLEGYYYKYPRIDKSLISTYHQGIITLTGGITGEIPDLILNRGEEQAEEAFVWWLETFGADFYVSLQRHGLEEEERVNEILLRFAKKYSVKVVATNDVFYVEKEDWKAHDALLCIDDGVPLSTPIGRGRGHRFGFPNHEYYYKTGEEMALLFQDLPEAIQNISDLVDKIEPIKLEKPILLPNFALPESFADEDGYLEYLTFVGAREKYPLDQDELSSEVTARIRHELGIIRNMGFAGYFLIVQDFIAAAKEMGVFVGPGRGSAAGSVVAYAIGITDVDPLRYDLLFERFLNPERVSMPDMDIDFDDDGRQKVIDYVIGKYGSNQVAHIITFGTMAARSSVRDVARVLELPLSEADKLAKKIPETVGTTLEKAYQEVPELKEIRNGSSLESQTLRLAETLEGSVRNTGIHAAGIIIAPKDMLELIPVATSKDTDLMVTQFDGRVIEDAGMLKMDFLGLKTLSILKTVIEFVQQNHGVYVPHDSIPLNDPATFDLYQKGGTVGTFQFESDGMRKHLRNLKPTGMDDLIAMNALYRPGPMQFIPDYIRRKHGDEEVGYPHEDLRDILEPTFGIMIYQEQIMMVAQRMADYTLGEADILRRIMGKKKVEQMAEEEEKFMARALAKGYEKAVAKEVFDKMALFAGYGFNKSHSAAYSILAYQTMYFKANYPADYMAAVLSHNMNDLKKVTFFIEECQKMGLPVDSPNLNTGISTFSVTNGRIQFGLSAIKGVGSGAIEAIVQEREENGAFKSIFDFAGRVDSRLCNKRAIESLIQAGAFDQLHENRAQVLASLEEVMAFGQRKQEETRRNQTSLFSGEKGSMTGLSEPRLREIQPWSMMEQLRRERESIGFYLSGHPLDRFREEIRLFTSQRLTEQTIHVITDRQQISLLGIITSIRRHVDSKRRPIAFLQVEDLDGSVEVCVFSESFDRYGGLLVEDTIVYVDGTLRNDGQVRLIANSFERAENLREKYQDKLVLRMNIETDKVGEEELTLITRLFNSHRGKTPVELWVQSPGLTQPLPMMVRKFVVEPSDELVQELRRVLGDENVRLAKKS